MPVQSGDETEIVSVRVLHDSASHRSFMTKMFAKQLTLTPQYKELFSVSTSAARKPQNVSTYRIRSLFGGDFNLVVWQIFIGLPNLNRAILTCTHKMN